MFVVQECYRTERATITRITNSQGTVTLYYSFTVEGKKYKSSDQFDSQINYVNIGEKCVVHYLPVFPGINNLKPYLKIENDTIICIPKFKK